MGDEELALIQPRLDMEAAYRAMAADFTSAGETMRSGGLQDFAGYVRRARTRALGHELPPGWVPCTTFWLVRDGTVVLGSSSLRHELNADLEYEGGHIGYAVRPSERRKGYGTRLLALTLGEARRLGLARVLVTCDRENVASARVIERNGGVLVGSVISRYDYRFGKPVSRYWIDL
jgi:predicted acetyltransferase